MKSVSLSELEDIFVSVRGCINTLREFAITVCSTYISEIAAFKWHVVYHVTFSYLSASSFTQMVSIFVTRQRDTGCLSKLEAPKRRKYSSLFSTQLYPINVANPPNCCKITQTVMVAMQCDVRNSRQQLGTNCLEWIKILELILPFDFLLCHGYCLIKNTKSIRQLLMIRNEKWNSRSFI